MSGIIRPVPDGGQGSTSSPTKRYGSAGAPVVGDDTTGGKLKPARDGDAITARDDDGGATEGAATVGPRSRPTGDATAQKQAVDGSRKVKKHIPRPDPEPTFPKPVIKPDMVFAPPLPGPPPGGAAHPAPGIPGGAVASTRPDQSITPAQEAEIRDTLIEHGLDENEVDRIIEQLEDGMPVGTVLGPISFPVPGGMPPIAAGGQAAGLLAQLQAGLAALATLPAPAASPAPPTHR